MFVLFCLLYKVDGAPLSISFIDIIKFVHTISVVVNHRSYCYLVGVVVSCLRDKVYCVMLMNPGLQYRTGSRHADMYRGGHAAGNSSYHHTNQAAAAAASAASSVPAAFLNSNIASSSTVI